MKRKPTFATSIGPVVYQTADLTDADRIADMAATLRSLLRKCRVHRDTRKAHVALLSDVDKGPGMAWQPEWDNAALSALTEALSHYAPPYTTFGQNHEGEYGFWPMNIDRLDDEGLIVKIRDHHEPDELRSVWGMEVAFVNDHGNVDCGRFDRRGRFHTYWSAV